MYSIAIIGKSKVGISLAQRLGGPTYPLFAHIPARAKSFSALRKNGGPDVVIIACRDDKIQEVSKRVLDSAGPNLKILVHTAGSLSFEVMPIRSGVERLMLHPIQTFAKPSSQLFENIYFGACSEKRKALTWAKSFVKELSASGVIELQKQDLPLYHALLVLASSGIVVLGMGLEELSNRIGWNRQTMKEAVNPLMNRALKNVLSNPASEVLTGPIAREDKSTIASHRKSLQAASPNLLSLYNALVQLAEH